MKFFVTKKNRCNPFLEINLEQIGALEKLGIIVTNDIKESDIIVSHNYKKLLPLILLYPKKKFLIWTNEPRYDTTFRSEIKLPFGLPSIQIMNVYGSDVFWHNLHFLGSYHYNYTNNLGIDINSKLDNLTKESLKLLNKKNKIVALFTNTLSKKTKLIKEGKNIDLSQLRCQYAIYGRERNMLDIYGDSWPKGYAIDNSGFGNEKQMPWWVEKIEILKDYKFNLCFENTANGYYVTEKIWQSIFAYSLPIYCSLYSNIYETFPENSFIDASLYKNDIELFDYIESISDNEFLERMNKCIDVFNTSIHEKLKFNELSTSDHLIRIIARFSIDTLPVR